MHLRYFFIRVASYVTRLFTEGTMMGDTTAPTLSTTLLSTTLKRGPGGDAVEYGTVDLATQLIKVNVLSWSVSEGSIATLQWGFETLTSKC